MTDSDLRKAGDGLGMGVWIGLILTAICVAGAFVLPFTEMYKILVPNSVQSLNELGDYFAGFMAPVALAWFVGTLFLQKHELRLQRRELEAAREVWEGQQVEQKRLADATTEANELAAKSLFMSMYSVSHQIIEAQAAATLYYIKKKTDSGSSLCNHEIHMMVRNISGETVSMALG